MKRWFCPWFILIGFAFLAIGTEPPTSISPGDGNANEVRPTGVPARHRTKAKAATESDSDSDTSATPRARRTERRAPKPRESDDDSVATQTVPGSVPKIGASSVIVVDVHSGQVLYEKNTDQIVAQTDTLAEPVKLNIKPGDTYVRIDLLRALLVKSPNDVARCLARDNAGSIEAFSERMNQRAAAIGATHSHWVNPNGLPDARQYSTARDLAMIARVAYANPTIRSIVCLPQLTFRYANGRTRELENTNKLLNRLPYSHAEKTGYTEAAGKCLIASGSRPGKDIIVVVLGDSSSHVWRDASALLSWALGM